MFPTWAVALVGLGLWLVYTNVSSLLKNIAAAKRSGLPYIVVPFNIYNMAWLVTHELWLPLIKRLPTAWTAGWLDYLEPDWVWKYLYDSIASKGDLFITVSPGLNNVWATNAEAIHQITTRREAFPKPLETYKILDLFGRNILTTEDGEWRAHRKITAPSFNEKNNILVFAEATRQAQGMLRKWTGEDGEGGFTLNEVHVDTMRLTLHIISDIGFGVKLLWPGEKQSGELSAQEAVYGSTVPPEGHSMSFEKALSTLLEYMTLVMIVPEWLLKRLPFHKAREAYEAFLNWRQYMNELFAQKVIEARAGQKAEGMDILGALVKSSYGDTSRAEKGEKLVLSDSEILGNAFVMLVAGHETTANAMHFSLMELAITPRAQRLVQKEVQTIFGEESPEKWDYESSINSLLGGIVGAVLNEQLRLMPAITALPKTVRSHDGVISVDGKKIILPVGSRINLNTIGVQRNPRYWPSQPSKITNRADDLNDFRPERWIVNGNAEEGHIVDSGVADDHDDFGGFTGQDSHAKLFRPVKGSYFPFSEGPRSCLGRRLAQVKVMSCFAVIFQAYSIELAVDKWATDEEVERMSDSEKRLLYKKAQDAARSKLREASSIITLKLQGGSGFIPVRVVRKGKERFIHLVDQ
ncbi:Cytochrome P450 4c21 [Lachnellula suecica]|uniref:Cytochrome P450 4c21 n=1 Tax=Lachnellula suecica TaxID=602035 RepID=A0A8T9C2X2_9HELO|nr:Cytochrome P450 4c21 [Lachnellula suecica]